MAAPSKTGAAPNGAAIAPHSSTAAKGASATLDIAIDPSHGTSTGQDPSKEPTPAPDHPEATPDAGYDSDGRSSTTSLTPSLRTPHTFRHRAYQSHAAGRYPFPCDAAERSRLDLVHAMHRVAMSNRLYYAPLPPAPARILDLGTGTGQWAIEMAERFPGARVLANDLAPVPATHGPPNVRFEVDDVEAPWTHAPGTFDFVHARALAGAVRDWPALVARSKRATRAGGWCEFVDYDGELRGADDSLPAGGALRSANARFIKALRERGAEPSPGPRLEGWLRDAGFVDVRATKIPLPVGAWPADGRLREVGAWNLVQIVEHVEGLVGWVFGRLLGDSEDEVRALCERLRAELLSPDVRPIFYLYDVYGRVPEETR